MNNKNVNWTRVVWLIGLSILVILLCVLAGYILPKEFQSNPEIGLTILLSAGLVCFVTALTITVAVLATLGLTDPGRAFGMPEGTIRAVIALSLILIFSIMSVFLYNTMRLPPTTQTTVLTKEQFDGLSTDEIIFSKPVDIGSERFFEVRRYIKPNPSGDDFAKQIITTISTLVVAVAAFYFGTRAVFRRRVAEVLL